MPDAYQHYTSPAHLCSNGHFRNSNQIVKILVLFGGKCLFPFNNNIDIIRHTNVLKRIMGIIIAIPLDI